MKASPLQTFRRCSNGMNTCRPLWLYDGRLFAFHETLQVARAPGLTQLPQSLGFNLANSLARNRELLPNLFKCVISFLSNPKAHPQNLLFARGQSSQHLTGLLPEIPLDRSLDRRRR